MCVSEIWKSRLLTLFVIAIMIPAIRVCTKQGDDSSSSAPDALHQIDDDGSAIYDEDTIA